jgi:hypothetical protein
VIRVEHDDGAGGRVAYAARDAVGTWHYGFSAAAVRLAAAGPKPLAWPTWWDWPPRE